MMRHFLLFFLLISSSAYVAPIKIPDELERRETATRVELVFDHNFFAGSSYNIIDLTNSLSNYKFAPGDVNYAGSYHFELEFSNISETDHVKLLNYLYSIEDISMGNGYEVNTTAHQLGQVSSTFTPINGTSIDAEKTLNWLASNLWDRDETRYTLFLLNLEDYDSATDHWFNIKPWDVDTENYSESFFSGSYGLKRGKQISAWGGIEGLPVHFIDISSKVWYGDFINDIFGPSYQDTTISKTIKDFSDRNSEGYISWLKRMIFPFFENLYSLFLFTPVILEQLEVTVNPTYQIPSVVFVDNDSLIAQRQWIISTSKMEGILNSAFPFLNFNVSLEWVYLQDYTEVDNAVDLYTVQEGDGSKYIEVSNGFLDYLQFNILSGFTGGIRDDNIPSLIFYLNDVEFRYFGVPISGLGGMGWQLQFIHDSRLYINGTRSRGFSHVLLHEIGHSLGFPHPFEIRDAWSSDFTASIVGYYSSYPDFSVYEKDALARLYADHYIIQADYLSSVASEDRDLVLGNAEYQKALFMYEERNYVDAILHSKASIKAFQSAKTNSSETQQSMQSFLPFSTSGILIILFILKFRKRGVQVQSS